MLDGKSARQHAQEHARALIGDWMKPREQQPKDQHTVPKFYLSAWADAEKRLTCLNRSTGHTSSRSPKKTTIQEDFYTLEMESGEMSYVIENMMAWVEDSAARAIRRVIEAPEAIDEVGVRDAMSAFIGFQLTRGLEQREWLRQGVDYVEKFMLKQLDTREAVAGRLVEVGIEPTPENVAEYLDLCKNIDEFSFEPHRNHAVEHMLGVACSMMEFVFCECRWHLIKLKQPLLVTTDQPVTKVRQPFHARRNAELLFPLGPSHLLILRENVTETWLYDDSWLINRHLSMFAHRYVFGRRDYERWDDLAAYVRGHQRPEMKVIEDGNVTVFSSNPAGLPPHLRSRWDEVA